MPGALLKSTAGWTEALALSGLAHDLAGSALCEKLAQPLPAYVLSLGIGGAGALGEDGHHDQHGVNGVIVGRRGLQTRLHQMAASPPRSTVTKRLFSRKGCADGDAGAVRTRKEWTQDRLAALAAAFDAGLSHELIGQALGVSKGAISGKLDRLAEADPEKWTRSATIITLKPDRSASAAKARAIEESIIGATLLALEPHMCRWPMAYTTEQTFCGDERVLPSWYCRDHLTCSTERGSTGASR